MEHRQVGHLRPMKSDGYAGWAEALRFLYCVMGVPTHLSLEQADQAGTA